MLRNNQRQDNGQQDDHGGDCQRPERSTGLTGLLRESPGGHASPDAHEADSIDDKRHQQANAQGQRSSELLGREVLTAGQRSR